MEFKYKKQESEIKRKEQSTLLLQKNPKKVPVVLEKDPECKLLEMEKKRFLLDKKSTVSQFMQLIRKKTVLQEGDALFLHVKGKYSITGEKTIEQIYNSYKDKDGFLYISYTNGLFFG